MNTASSSSPSPVVNIAHTLAPFACTTHTNALLLAGSERQNLLEIRLGLRSATERIVALDEEGRKALPVEVREAAAVALRVLRDARFAHPAGRFDNAKRFFLAEEERCACCAVRNPSRRWSNTENAHGRSAVHCGALMAVKAPSAKAVKALDAALFPQV